MLVLAFPCPVSRGHVAHCGFCGCGMTEGAMPDCCVGACITLTPPLTLASPSGDTRQSATELPDNTRCPFSFLVVLWGLHGPVMGLRGSVAQELVSSLSCFFLEREFIYGTTNMAMHEVRWCLL